MSSPGQINLPLPVEGCLLGVDYGTVRIGLAISTPSQSMAAGLETYQRQTMAQDEKKYRKIIEEYRIHGIVVGSPIHVNGRESQKSAEAETYARWLNQFTGLPVTLHDERYTSSLAADALREAGIKSHKHKGRLDKLAAQMMLQSYLDRRAELRHQQSITPEIQPK